MSEHISSTPTVGEVFDDLYTRADEQIRAIRALTGADSSIEQLRQEMSELGLELIASAEPSSSQSGDISISNGGSQVETDGPEDVWSRYDQVNAGSFLRRSRALFYVRRHVVTKEDGSAVEVPKEVAAYRGKAQFLMPQYELVRTDAGLIKATIQPLDHLSEDGDPDKWLDSQGGAAVVAETAEFAGSSEYAGETPRSDLDWHENTRLRLIAQAIGRGIGNAELLAGGEKLEAVFPDLAQARPQARPKRFSIRRPVRS